MTNSHVDDAATAMWSVLLIETDPALLGDLAQFFEEIGWETHEALSAEDAIRTFDRHLPDLVLVDADLPGIGGLDLLDVLVARGAAVAMLAAQAAVATAIDAMERGAETLLTTPVDYPLLRSVALRVAEKIQLRRTNRLLSQQPSGSRLTALGSSARMLELARHVALVAKSPRTSTLLQGESGTGKGFVARMIHAQGPRSRGPFVEVNCAGLAPNLLESELFGHERGAFTDAKETRPGLFELAHGGTLFLDEIGDMDVALQPKLLKVLDGHSFRRVGGTREIRSDVRVIAATNADLRAAVRAGTFREDLYYRLAVFPLTVPPLRERSQEDVLAIVHATLRELRRAEPDVPAEISPKALRLLVQNAWPGNVRELRNALEHAAVMARGETTILPEHLPLAVRGPAAPRAERHTWEVATLEEVQRRHIERTLHLTRGNRTTAAGKLGISRATLLSKIREYGLEQVGKAAA